MKVFKFGGASVKDADGVRNVARILNSYVQDRVVVVVSAMAKTTNDMERVVDLQFKEQYTDALEQLNQVKEFHFDILGQLGLKDTTIIDKIFDYAKSRLDAKIDENYDQLYDQIVPIGELCSTKIISAFLENENQKNIWLDARSLVLTNQNYRSAEVDWVKSEKKILDTFQTAGPNKLWITQGFIGGTEEGYITTLGREGSDYSAAVLASVLKADEVVIWKDVPGMLNADPKYFDNTEILKNISYREATELAYYGASVIHPKTVKPLQNKGIPLYVKSFDNPLEKGSLINENGDKDSLLPSYIVKENQIMISISPKDYSFMVEHNLSDVFSTFSKHGVSIAIMQNSALSFTAIFDCSERILEAMVRELQRTYRVKYNEGLSLLTVRHYSEDVLKELVKGFLVLLEQKTRETARFVLKRKSVG